MSLYWTIDSRQRTVHIVAEGDVSTVDVMAFFDAVEGAKALSYSKLLDGKGGRLAMTKDEMTALAVRIRAHHDQSAMAALAIVANGEQRHEAARLLGAAAGADRPVRVFDDVRSARRWIETRARR